MKKAKYEGKFIVINYKHLDRLTIEQVKGLSKLLLAMNNKNKYHVCNRDEVYADQVRKVIIDGKQIKATMKKWEKENPDREFMPQLGENR